MNKLHVIALLAALLPFSGEAQESRVPRAEVKPRLVLRELSVGLTDPPDPDLPPGPCVVASVSLEAVTGRDAHLYRQGVITVDGKIEDDRTDQPRLLVNTRGKGGEAILSGLVAGQPDGIDPCWDVAAVLTNLRTGEVLDRQLYHADPVR